MWKICILLAVIIMLLAIGYIPLIVISGSPYNNREVEPCCPKSSIMDLQILLNKEGFMLSVDGILGPQTINAYNRWRILNDVNR